MIETDRRTDIEGFCGKFEERIIDYSQIQTFFMSTETARHNL